MAAYLRAVIILTGGGLQDKRKDVRSGKGKSQDRKGRMQMEQRILRYRKYIDELLKRDDVDWEETIRQHLIQVSFFQHERLIHLIVTVTFALLEVVVIALSVTAFTLGVGLLALGLLVLLIPYIRHYYILENEVQKMYRQYDQMVEKRGIRDYFL